MNHYWVNKNNYTDPPSDKFERSRTFPWRTKRLREVTILEPPPKFVHTLGTFTMDRHFFSDGGSIPPAVQWLLGIDYAKYPVCFYLHDSAYRHGGLWRMENGTRFFFPLRRDEADQLLHDAMLSDSAPEWEADTVRRGLELGGWYAWGQHEQQRKDEEKKRKSAGLQTPAES